MRDAPAEQQALSLSVNECLNTRTRSAHLRDPVIAALPDADCVHPGSTSIQVTYAENQTLQ